ncbi:MAG: DUF2889 domain-containing protein [Rhodospirillales bacterium]|jgi:hypothetical protein|nr:DUF2889 domain-containing protein [Rhodospirillales bacterium]
MPLSPPAPREALHTRTIVINGYRRDDGLYDIEAQLTDTKTYSFPNENRGTIEAGEPLHGMWMRLTVDEDMRIVAAEAATDYAPYGICPQAAPNFARLEGLVIGKGFLRAVNQAVGGTVGCTHLRELLQQMATTAYQTIKPARAHREIARAAAGDKAASGESLDARISQHFGGAPKILNTCLAYSSDGPVVRQRWPHLYTGR